MGAYAGGFVLVSRDAATPQQLAVARKMLGYLEDGRKLAGVSIQSLTRYLDDGSVVLAQVVGSTHRVVVTAPERRAESRPAVTALWIPRGFLVHPASKQSPHGVGLPVIPTGAGPYASANLAPGLDFARWSGGGPLGQVLLTTDSNAGYMASNWLAAPMFYGKILDNPYASANDDAAPTGAKWAAYRPEFVDFTPGREGELLGGARELWNAVNAYRSSAGLVAATAPLRGLYRPASMLGYLARRIGATQADYPPGYKTASERLAKDGATWYQPNEYADFGAFGFSAAQAVQNWSTDYPTQFNLAPSAGEGGAVIADVADNAGALALALQVRQQWLMAGRRSFQSQDTTLPPISWEAPPSLNVGWMTWPIKYYDHAVYAPASIFDADGSFWLKFLGGTHDARPALGPHVYCRGRTLATLPTAGVVLGAAIQTLAGVDRLVVVAHHPADNTGLTSGTQGLTPVARVWYADFPHGNRLRLRADAPVTDVTPDPVPADPLRVYWHDAGTINVPGTRYISLWAPSADGTKLVCLRDLSTAQNRADEIAARISTFAPDTIQWWTVGCMDGAHDVAEAPQLLELMVGALPTPQLVQGTLAAASATWRRDYTLPKAPPSYFLQGTLPVQHDAAVPMAAAYDANGVVRIVYSAKAQLLISTYLPSTHPGPYAMTQVALAYRYLGIGDTAAEFDSDLEQLTLYHCDVAVDGMDCNAEPPQVLDVGTLTFVADGVRALRALDYATGFYGSGGAITRDTPSPSPTYALASFNPKAPAAVLNTTDAVHVVRTYRGGELVDESTFAHPYGQMFAYRGMFLYAPKTTDPNTLPLGDDLIVRFPETPSQFVQPFYAERFGEQLYGYQVGLGFPASDYVMPNDMPTGPEYLAAMYAGTTATLTAEARPVVGGKAFASFEVPDYGGEWISEAVIV